MKRDNSVLTGARWRASSYSGGQGNCVEVAADILRTVPVQDGEQSDGRLPTFTSPAWRASSYSSGQDQCVEVADNDPRTVPVRDSKRPGGPVLTFAPDAWRAFIASVR